MVVWRHSYSWIDYGKLRVDTFDSWMIFVSGTIVATVVEIVEVWLMETFAAFSASLHPWLHQIPSMFDAIETGMSGTIGELFQGPD